MTRDKQSSGIKYAAVLKKSRRDQALNMKEFAVRAGISYSIAREWFQLRGFPRVQSFVFWQDFVEWRKDQNREQVSPSVSSVGLTGVKARPIQWPPRAAQILCDVGKKVF
jgi:hypothetical protein